MPPGRVARHLRRPGPPSPRALPGCLHSRLVTSSPQAPSAPRSRRGLPVVPGLTGGAWDTRTPAQQRSVQDKAVRAQVVDAVAPFSPWWRARFAALGRPGASYDGVAKVRELPAVGESDVCPDGDARGAAGLVLQASEAGFALHAPGPVLRRALTRRLVAPAGYRAIVEQDTRPTTFVWAGHAVRFPVASTRGDLDVVTRAGARALGVAGLTPADVLVVALEEGPGGPGAAAQSLRLGALGLGIPGLSPGAAAADVAEALRLVPATALAVATGDAPALLDDLDEAGAPLSTLTTLLLVGAPDDEQRAETVAAVRRAGLSGVQVVAVHVPEGHRLLWAECPRGGADAGLHTHPDLELVDLADPDTGEGHDSAPGEVVVTQLGLRGSALLRWRTGDVATRVVAACPGCGRTVPRLLGLRAGALVPSLRVRGGTRRVDLRTVTGVVAAAPEVADFRVVVGGGRRSAVDEVVVALLVRSGADEDAAVAAVTGDLQGLPVPVRVAVVDELPGTTPDNQVAGRLLRR